MSWTSVPGIITAARDALLACGSVSTLGATQNNCHYPDMSVKITTETLPFFVFAPVSHRIERAAPGETFGTGSITITGYFPDTTAQSAAETAAQTIAKELCSGTTGLFVTGVDVGMASRVRRAKKAGAEDSVTKAYYTLTLTVEWQG